MTTNKIIYFDLDGVLANFNKRIELLTGKPRQLIGKKELWATVNQDDQFFYKLEPMPLVETVNKLIPYQNIHILTATGNNYSEVAPQKMQWCIKHLNIQRSKIHIVKSGKDKAHWATPDSILVDDTLEVIELWEKASGIGIWWKTKEAE